MTTIPALKVIDVHKKIGRKEIIKGISFEVMPGEVFGFLGPNGAGKTTTIRMLTGLIRPTLGKILIGGKNVRTEFTEAMKNLGCIVENPEMYPFLTGYENLAYFARMDPSIPRNRLDEVAALVGLTGRIHDKVKTYSLGMRQRLGIAQALLLDEPTNGLDPAGIREMREFIRSLAEKAHLSVLVSSHLLSEVQLMCDKVAIIHNGQVIRTGNVHELLSEKARTFWKVAPIEKARTLLQAETQVAEGEDGLLVTPYDEEKNALWNEMLVQNGVRVKEMKAVLPALEDLFLELTGGRKK